MIAADEQFVKKRQKVFDRTMAYVDEGKGDPIVFLHGNPTSSYLWRNVIPHLTKLGRCIAPDLIGMGDSDKLESSGPLSYRFSEHRAYLHAFFEALEIKNNVVLVIHDWGSALGFDWAKAHPQAVQGIAYMEAIVHPITWEDWPEIGRDIFRALRSPAGEEMILEKNVFIEEILPASVLRGLTEAEMNVYRRPFLNTGEDRRPTLTWPRELPIAGEPADVVEIVNSYGKWLESSDLPKLFINADPGIILTGAPREYCRSWPNQEEVTVKGLHFIQEDSPDEIGKAVCGFVKKLRS
ncbi:MAG: haloalkane dehalogenase [Desulfobacterales bacterium]